ncbi:ATP-binding protein [Streptomyces cinnamoneus]|uniref:ATP-binding protein n=1 Tax=Streptomyces cinnamoneus TaxID=53446 RepID=A0A2G1XK10_STRCJ|nr:AAA family ATPase [Streptomyces cinnamoneus]PHQ51511.1 ATP-binding protein [Streptomyces cinnamoneus]PPT11693.1 ATP-binding protein [Streptomyces cinnamoneus]
MLTTLAVENYRSLRRLIVPLGRLNVITGANGSGKSSLYRALRLLADSARGGAVAALAREGGLPSTLWAGTKRGAGKSPAASLRLGFAGDEFGYAVDFGHPVPTSGLGGAPSMFARDPEIKRECTWAGPVLRPSALLSDRSGPAVRTRTADGSWHQSVNALRPYDSMLGELADPRLAPDLLRLREHMRSWRFYDHVRTDAQAPARSARTGTRTPVLGHDGADLAAALQTIRETGDPGALDAAVDAAFPASSVEITSEAGRFELWLRQPGLLRPLSVAELSDGTLRYLLWSAALLTPRPPALLVLNEPESSLHPDLLPPLADLILTAARDTQIVVVTHAPDLVDALTGAAPDHRLDVNAVTLVKDSLGQTDVAGRDSMLDEPLWHWPKR